MIDKLVAIDVETSGLSFDGDVTHNHQIVSIGLIVADNEFNEIDSFYREIKHNGTSHWSSKAEAIHGLSKEYLETNGIEEGQAVLEITEFLLKYFNPDESILFLGHNARSFDIPFFNKLTNKFDIYFKISHRCVDSFSIGFVAFGAENSEELFKIFYKNRDKHNALDDARMSLGCCQKLMKIIQEI